MPSRDHQIRRQRQARARRRRRRLGALAVALAVLVLVGWALAHGGGGSHAPGTAAAAGRPKPRRIVPPGPIPGYLLIADRGNDRLLLVDGRRRILWRYPRPGRGLAAPFYFDDDAFFGAGYRQIISNQEDQHTIQVLSFPQGRLLWRYGHFDRKGSAPGYLNTPDDAYLLPGGVRSVADAYNCRVLFIDRGGRVVRSIGSAGVCAHDPPRTLGAVNGATPLPDGGTLVSEIAGSWIDDIGPGGRLRWSFRAPVAYPSDPQLLPGGRILLADYTRPGSILILDRQGRVLWRYGPASGAAALDHPSLAEPITRDLVAVNDDYRDRVVLISIRRQRIVWQYGHTDRPGTAPGFLRTPDGMDLLPAAAAERSPVVRALARRALRCSRARPMPACRRS